MSIQPASTSSTPISRVDKPGGNDGGSVNDSRHAAPFSRPTPPQVDGCFPFFNPFANCFRGKSAPAVVASVGNANAMPSGANGGQPAVVLQPGAQPFFASDVLNRSNGRSMEERWFGGRLSGPGVELVIGGKPAGQGNT